MKLDTRLALFVLFLSICPDDAKKLKLCVVRCKITHSIINEICPYYEEKSTKAGCVIANDRLECMRLVVRGVADFTVAEPEDLVIAVENLEYHIMVTHELRTWKNETVRTEMVAVMHDDLADFSSIRKSKLCYPGLESNDPNERDFTSYFEKKLIPRECDPRKTLLENRISSLSNHFEAACIAGSWSLDSTFDTYLKGKYKNLCSLCENPLGCYANDKYYGREGALICLTENVGDVAWAKLTSVTKHFMIEDVRTQDFNYFCPDGTVRSATSEKCVWVGEPWPVVIARADMAERVSQLIAHMIDTDEQLLRLLKSSSVNAPIVALKNMQSPEDYLRKFSAYADAVSPSACYPLREVKWCVTSNLEYRKCETMRSAANAYNIYPEIFCVQESSPQACMKAVAKKYADVYVVKPHEELEASKFELRPILHMLSNNRDDLNIVGALVKKQSKFHSFKDLKDAKACFTGYKSVGWNAVTAKIIDTLQGESSCSDTEMIEKYFGPSCVYNSSSSNSPVPKKLNSLCDEFKKSHSFEKYTDDGDVMSLKCLADAGDVAFVNVSRAKEVFQQHEKNFADTFRLLCLEDTNPGKNCILTWTTLGSIMVRKNISTLEENEMREMILSLDKYFGVTYGRTPLLALYNPYDNVSDVIFPDRTRHLHREVTHVRSGKSYSDILQDLVKYQTTCNSANQVYSKSNGIHVILIFTLVTHLANNLYY